MATAILGSGLGAVGTTVGGGAGTAGGAFLGFVLGTAGAVAGGIIDQKFVYPALFGSEDTDAPNYPTSQGATDGDPAALVYGQAAITSGTIIWLGNKEIDQRSNGETTVVQPMAVGICKNETNKLLKVWANGEPIITNDITDTSQSVVANFFLQTGTTGPLAGVNILTVSLHEPYVDIFNVGDSITITDADDAANNFSDVIEAKYLNDGFLNLVFTRSGVNKNSDTITISLGAEGQSYKVAQGFTFYTGTSTQAADSTIVSKEGSDVPGFRGTTYIVFNKLRIDSYGGVPPQFTFLIEQDPATTLDEVVDDLMVRSGYSSSQFDVTDIASITFRGLSILGNYRLATYIPLFVFGYDIDVFDSGTKIVFKQRTTIAVKTLIEDDLGYHEGRTEPSFLPVRFSDISDFAVPNELNLHYRSSFRDYQLTVAKEQAIAGVISTVEDLRLPFTFTDTEARNVAQRLLWSFQNDRINVNFFLGPKHTDLLPGDVVSLTVDSQTYLITLNSVTLGKNFLVECKGIVKDQDTAVQSSVDNSLKTFLELTPEPTQPLFATILDIPAVFDSDVLDPVLYFASYASDNTNFRGAFVSRSSDATNWKLLASTANDHVVGSTDTVLATTTNFSTFDEINTVDITLDNGTLSSVTETQVLEDRVNMFLIGTEILYAKTATSIGTNQYRLSGLLRGTRNTEDQAGSHAIDEQVVLLNGVTANDIARIPVTFSDQGREQWFDITGFGGDAGTGIRVTDDVTPLSIDLKVLKPFSPTDLIGTRDGSNNLAISWKRRSRAFGGEFKDGGTPLVDDVELYEVEILDGPDGSVLREFSVSDVTTQDYTAAQQTLDGFTPGDPIDVRVYQVSPIYGKGKGEEDEI